MSEKINIARIKKFGHNFEISIEQKKMAVVIPSQHAGKLYQYVKNNSKILKEEWLNNGDWKVNLEIPAGLAGVY